MKYLIGLSFFLIFLSAKGQALRDINYNYLYNPGESFTVDLTAVHHENGSWSVFYKFLLKDTTQSTDDYSLEFGLRESLIEKESTPLGSEAEVQETKRGRLDLSGKINLPSISTPKVFVVRVIRTSLKRAWLFSKILDPNYPVDSYVTVNNEILSKPFINKSSKVALQESGTKTVSYYNDVFPAAQPPFVEAQARVAKAIKSDSSFFLSPGQETEFKKQGLYLIQKDTNAVSGISFRVEDDYPKLTKIPSLAGPLLYICTKQEYDKLLLAKNDKKAFDRIILSITSDTDRARKFMRSYFRRVEYANTYFTSYKEGWKTDRGMIFIVFGLPDEVFKFTDREVWNYKNEEFKVSFSFAKSSSLFDPENYVLIREKKYQDTWYEVIDLWRNSRF